MGGELGLYDWSWSCPNSLAGLTFSNGWGFIIGGGRLALC